jgi:magnesium transporter
MLINCVVYEKGRKIADIPVEDISEHVGLPGRFVWVALADATDAELDQMQAEFGLHPLAVEDARHGHQRPKIEEFGDQLFAVMHLVDVSTADATLGEVNVFVGPNFVVSVRNNSPKHFLGVRERAEREPELLAHGSGYVFYALMDAVVDRYFPGVDLLETELESIEAQIFERGTARPNIERLYALKRRAMVLRHAVAALREAVSKLHGGRVPGICSQTQDYFRDVDDHLRRINGSIDGIRDTIGTAIQVNLSMVAIEDGETVKSLAAWAGIFAAATAFAGVWGMNFEVMPELKWRWGYPAALFVIAMTCGLLWRRFRRAGWL